MPFFKKKPVTIEAVQYKEYGKLVKGMCNSRSCYLSGNTRPHVHTIHDNQIVILEIGDYVIPEPDGEHYYPCKPDIFETNYSPANQLPTTSGVESARIWVKASERLPQSCESLFIKIEGKKSTGSWNPFHEKFVDDHGNLHSTDQVEWLDESAVTPFTPTIVMPGILSDPNFGELPSAKITMPISSLKEREIAFAEWILQEEFYLEDGKWWKNGLKGWQYFTTEQIYQEYLESLNKKP